MMIKWLFILFFMMESALFSQNKPETIKISLGYHVDPCQGPLLLALADGIFEEFGLHVEILNAHGGEEASKMVASKIADLGITKLPNHIVRVAKGMPLRRAFTLVDTCLERLVVRPDLGDLKNLKGTRIGFNTSNPDFSMLVLDQILKKSGLTREDITLIAFKHGLAHAFIHGQIDAIFIAVDPDDIKLLEEKNIPFKTYSYTEFGIPDFDQFLIFVHRDRQNAPFIGRLSAALTKASQHIRRSPDQSWQKICALFPEIDTTFHFKKWRFLFSQFSQNPQALDIEKYQVLLDFMNSAKVDQKPLLKRPIYLDEIIVGA